MKREFCHFEYEIRWHEMSTAFYSPFFLLFLSFFLYWKHNFDYRNENFSQFHAWFDRNVESVFVVVIEILNIDYYYQSTERCRNKMLFEVLMW